YMNNKDKAFITGILVFIIFILFILVSGKHFQASAQSVKQPIEFNHKKHLQDVGLECQNCHTLVLTYYRASIPNIEVCSMCHDEGGDGQNASNPKTQKVLEYIKKGEAIPWQKVYQMPDHVYFSHQRHVVMGRIECVTCHGKIDQTTLPITTAAVKHTMDSCMNCHKKSGVSNDCVACHK
ncbi:MAG: cytochrome c3 family protein, partial [Candidatus Tectomicrobia bacterium]|nr:cytochrome c3 family protein [Candidatus Tectomicrobia bacterium]